MWSQHCLSPLRVLAQSEDTIFFVLVPGVLVTCRRYIVENVTEKMATLQDERTLNTHRDSRNVSTTCRLNYLPRSSPLYRSQPAPPPPHKKKQRSICCEVFTRTSLLAGRCSKTRYRKDSTSKGHPLTNLQRSDRKMRASIPTPSGTSVPEFSYLQGDLPKNSRYQLGDLSQNSHTKRGICPRIPIPAG